MSTGSYLKFDISSRRKCIISSVVLVKSLGDIFS